tara:strand:+ start:136 stop:429 length:294 start_codon:yes stop_codon:yes gene_type:complete
MKKLLLLTITGMFLISCGGGGWSNEDVSKAVNECVEDDGMAKSDCECLVKQAEDKWDSYDEMMAMQENDDPSEEEMADIMTWAMQAMADCDINPMDY